MAEKSTTVVPELNAEGQALFTPDHLKALGLDNLEELKQISTSMKNRSNLELQENIAANFKEAVIEMQKGMRAAEATSHAKYDAEVYKAIDEEGLYKRYSNGDRAEKSAIKSYLIDEKGYNPHLVDLHLAPMTYMKSVQAPLDPTDKTGQVAEQKELQTTHDFFLMKAAAMGGFSAMADGSTRPDHAVLRTVAEQMVDQKFFGADVILRAVNQSANTTTASNGLEWINPAVSSQLLRDLEMGLVVFGLFQQFTMTKKEQTFPMLGARGLAFRGSEAVLPANLVQNMMTSVTPQTAKGTWTAEKIVGLTVSSNEFLEDSDVPAMTIYRQDLADKIVRGIESAMINGSSLTNDYDNAGADGSRWWANTATETSFQTSRGATDVRNCWDGIRKLTPAAAKIDAANVKPTLALLRQMRAAMGVYAHDNSKLVYLMSFESIMNTMNISELLTYMNFASNATVLTGQLTALDTVPIIFTDHIPNYLSPSGVYSGAAPGTGTQNRTSILCVHRGGMYVGNRRQLTIEQDKMFLSDMSYVGATWRGDVQPAFTPGQKWVSQLYNVAV